MPTGTPFVFKLKAPQHAIAGFGFFSGFSVLPDWLAWDTVGEGNGVATLELLRERLGVIREGARIDADPQGRIGCYLIAEAVFFPKDGWVRAPSNWQPRTQSGASFDLSSGEGLRVWQECLARAAELHLAVVPPVAEAERARFGTPLLHRPRLGQGIFRVHVLDAYGRACSVTGEHSLPVLEAAHIRPYARGGEHDVNNGLILRSDLHRLFDRGYVTVDEAQRLLVGKRLKEDFDNGRLYYALHGKKLELPSDQLLRPSADALDWHREHVYLG